MKEITITQEEAEHMLKTHDMTEEDLLSRGFVVEKSIELSLPETVELGVRIYNEKENIPISCDKLSTCVKRTELEGSLDSHFVNRSSIFTQNGKTFKVDARIFVQVTELKDYSTGVGS